VKQPSLSNRKVRRRPGEKASGYPPIVSFEILESGEVKNAWVKRSSGMADVDALALDWVRLALYRKRPGCGVITSQASVIIDFR
jgi:TonB family protein